MLSPPTPKKFFTIISSTIVTGTGNIRVHNHEILPSVTLHQITNIPVDLKPDGEEARLTADMMVRH
jgi:hypothetical protein